MDAVKLKRDKVVSERWIKTKQELEAKFKKMEERRDSKLALGPGPKCFQYSQL